MTKFFTFLTIITFTHLGAQTVTDFEEFNVPIDSFLNGSDGSGGFTAKNAFFPNTFQDFGTFTAWGGWSISTSTDITTAGFTNQYSAISGKGYDNSDTYAVTFVGSGSQIEIIHEQGPTIVDGMYINNGTYPYLSMLEGDNFAKQFGGETGDDPDFFLLTIKKYLNGQLSIDSVNFYLADYRFDDNNLDYIVNDWTYVDLTPLGHVDSLLFTLSSSDVGVYGMNTPAYFCIDNFTTSPTLASNSNTYLNLSVYPNPTQDFINIELPQSSPSDLFIYNSNGQKVLQKSNFENEILLNVQDYPIGNYQVIIKQDKETYRTTFIKM